MEHFFFTGNKKEKMQSLLGSYLTVDVSKQLTCVMNFIKLIYPTCFLTKRAEKQ